LLIFDVEDNLSGQVPRLTIYHADVIELSHVVLIARGRVIGNHRHVIDFLGIELLQLAFQESELPLVVDQFTLAILVA